MHGRRRTNASVREENKINYKFVTTQTNPHFVQKDDETDNLYIALQ